MVIEQNVLLTEYERTGIEVDGADFQPADHQYL